MFLTTLAPHWLLIHFLTFLIFSSGIANVAVAQTSSLSSQGGTTSNTDLLSSLTGAAPLQPMVSPTATVPPMMASQTMGMPGMMPMGAQPVGMQPMMNQMGMQQVPMMQPVMGMQNPAGMQPMVSTHMF